ncbi:MAG TPA: response regulator, partial [Burkholderiales bacterium]|nr:response regulator [Burkholderiales bacterium]
MTHKTLRVLVVEDAHADAELVVHELRRAGLAIDWQRVATKADFIAALDRPPEIILSDYTMPGFSVPMAISVMRERGLDIPVIVVTGSMGDEAAAECMRLGVA